MEVFYLSLKILNEIIILITYLLELKIIYT